MIAYSYFLQGGPFGMGLLTLLLIGLCIAAWKAPAWVSNIGKIACAFSILYALLGTLGQGGLACCTPWGQEELDTTEQLN